LNKVAHLGDARKRIGGTVKVAQKLGGKRQEKERKKKDHIIGHLNAPYRKMPMETSGGDLNPRRKSTRGPRDRGDTQKKVKKVRGEKSIKELWEIVQKRVEDQGQPYMVWPKDEGRLKGRKEDKGEGVVSGIKRDQGKKEKGKNRRGQSSWDGKC